jgi:ribosomal protein S18 acetylase RimI-like enzyme
MREEAPKFTLRAASAADAPFVYEMHRATMKDYVTQVWGWDEAFQAEMFSKWFVPEQFQIIVLDGQDVGLLAVEQRATELFLSTIEILPAYQGRGLGAAVVRSILAQAAAARVPAALQVLKVNPARRLYERLGFSISGETATHYQMRTS